MYLVGADHPNKRSAQIHLERLVSDAIQPAFDALLRVVDEVLPVERQDAEAAKTIVLGHPQLSARDALHLATMNRHGITTVFSFDRDFDTYPGISRIG